MDKINKQLQKIKAEKRLGLMTHIVAGYPSLPESKKIALTMLDLGIDFLEIQIPFSDPMADGPTLMRANQKALNRGFKVKMVMDLIRELSKKSKVPLFIMSYFNIILQYGVKNFCQNVSLSGCSGLIVPDMPLEEERSEKLIYYAKQKNLAVIRLLSPASTKKRIVLNSNYEDGFVYFVSRKGITGSQLKLKSDLGLYIKKIRKYFSVPIGIGFGISKPQHIKKIKKYADLVVVGSSVIDVYDKAEFGKKISSIKKFLLRLMKEL